MTAPLEAVEAITFDFGNTLVPVGREGLRAVVERTADAVVEDDPRIDRQAFLRIWAEERERQLREEVPRFREVDLGERLVRVFARLRGMAPPAEDERWDQPAATRLSEPAESERALVHYSAAFVAGLPPTPGVGQMLQRLAAGRTLAILSNWPLAETVDRYAEAHGWTGSLSAIVVSQRVGTIKPDPAIFEAARAAIGWPEPGAILHVGDDWAADVAGAKAVGWRVAWIRDRPADSPLPTSDPDRSFEPDAELARITDLEDAVGDPRAVASRTTASTLRTGSR